MSEKRHTSTICYVEIPAPDVEKAGEFYKSIFGWTITPSHLSDKAYWEFRTGDSQLTGGLDSSLPVGRGGVLLYLSVAKIGETLEAIQRAGGSIVRDKFDIGGGHGFSAFFQDPNGNCLGLFSKS